MKIQTPQSLEDNPDFVERNGVFVRVKPTKPTKGKKPCSGCAKRREAAKAAAKAYAEGKPFTIVERIAAAKAAFREKLKDGS